MMTEEDRQLRAAAENLLSGSHQSQRGSYTQRSISSINRDYIISEDIIAGTRHNGRMSSVRRFFCLLVTFDLLFTCLMWLICTTIAGENISTAFIEQILHYGIKTSLFDIVMVAFCRFTFLLLFYALFHLNHWLIVALTTATTCAFLGAKAYFFSWTEVTQPGFQALLILTSFVLAWGEAWFFDCRVVPQELQAGEWLLSPVDNERAPLLRRMMDGPPSRMAESMGNFFTPMDSPTHSDSEDDHVRGGRLHHTTSDDFLTVLQLFPSLPHDKVEELREKAASVIDTSYELLTSNQWQTLNITPQGDVVSMMFSNYGKILKIVGIVNMSANQLIDTLHANVEDIPSWNDDVALVKRIKKINEDTDVIYQSTKTLGGGLIGARDFVTLRHRNVRGEYFMSSGISVHINLPQRKDYIRAENAIVCCAAEKIGADGDSDGNKCRVTWMLHTNLKGWIPQKLIDSSVASVLERTISYLRSYVERLSDTTG